MFNVCLSQLLNLSDRFLFSNSICSQMCTYQCVFLRHVRADGRPLNVQISCVLRGRGIGASQADCVTLGSLNGLWPRGCYLHRLCHVRKKKIWFVRLKIYSSSSIQGLKRLTQTKRQTEKHNFSALIFFTLNNIQALGLCSNSLRV